MSVETVLFWVFAVATILSSALVITARNPISSAMALVGMFFFLAGIYVLLLAHTLAVIQVLVYAGAIMVLFLFVIMLLSLGEVGVGAPITLSRIAGAVTSAGLLVVLSVAILRMPLGAAPPIAGERAETYGTLAQLGQVLYTQWLFPFEAVSLLLLVAMVGAVVVAKTRI